MIDSIQIFYSTENREKLIEMMFLANEFIMSIFSKSSINFELKDDKSPVTEADIGANNILINKLNELFPSIPVVSEEDNSSHILIPKNNKIYWIIDPLDGTKEFINGRDEFTCNVGLIENGQPKLGLVSLPAKQLVYLGGKDFGSFKINNRRELKPIKYNSIKGLTRVVASKSHLNEKTKEFISSIKTKVDLVQAGSSLKFLKIAEGQADIYPRLGPTSEWDTAAAHAILEGAGGKVQQINGENLLYGKEDILNPNFIAHGEK
tara:strand:+ start:152 stop:940 length:789 start_codon:yes stop_codon:yes gene_type:complete